MSRIKLKTQLRIDKSENPGATNCLIESSTRRTRSDAFGVSAHVPVGQDTQQPQQRDRHVLHDLRDYAISIAAVRLSLRESPFGVRSGNSAA